MWAILSVVFAACSLCLLSWLIARPFAVTGQPEKHGQPAWLRFLWPWVEAAVPVVQPFVTWRLRRKLQTLLEQAGADYYTSPQHLCATQCVLASFGALVTAGLLLTGAGGASSTLIGATIASCIFALWPWQQLREKVQRRKRDLLRELPFVLDMVTLCVEAGLNFHGALKQASIHGPDGPMSQELRYLLADIRAGTSRQDALNAWAKRCDIAPVHQFVATIAQAEQSGMSLGPVLRAQADQWRNERFLEAERRALEAPVKLMFPLVICIFPCTFLIIAFPIAIQFLGLLE